MKEHITEKPYAKFLEDSLASLNDIDADAIVILAVEPGRGTLYCGWNLSFADLAVLSGVLQTRMVEQGMEDEHRAEDAHRKTDELRERLIAMLTDDPDSEDDEEGDEEE